MPWLAPDGAVEPTDADVYPALHLVSRPMPPRGSGSLHEPKFDAWRAQVIIAVGAVRI